jgi:hypothetical protein
MRPHRHDPTPHTFDNHRINRHPTRVTAVALFD